METLDCGVNRLGNLASTVPERIALNVFARTFRRHRNLDSPPPHGYISALRSHLEVNAMVLPQRELAQRLITHDEYLTQERAATERHEYLDGVIYEMPGESLSHGRISTNITGASGVQLRRGPCEAFSKDMKVLSGPFIGRRGATKGLFSYPDIVIVCGEPKFHDERRDVLLNPTAIIEVLSPATESFDRGEKFRRYHAWLPSLRDYVLVSQHAPCVESYRRLENNRWEVTLAAGLESTVVIASANCTLTLADAYERVEFPAENPTEPDDANEDGELLVPPSETDA
jgi:Uma2 family endonuclease